MLSAEEILFGGQAVGTHVTGRYIDMLWRPSGLEVTQSGLAVLDVLETEDLMSGARETGARLLAGLRDLQSRFEFVGDVRGRGLFLGVELVRDSAGREPWREAAGYVVNRLRDAGILIGTDGLSDNVLKIRPPMCFGGQDADELLEQLHHIFADWQSRHPDT